jgi:hypothetical protein
MGLKSQGGMAPFNPALSIVIIDGGLREVQDGHHSRKSRSPDLVMG